MNKKIEIGYLIISTLFLNEIFFNYSFHFSLTYIIVIIFSLLPFFYISEFLDKLNLKITLLTMFVFVSAGFYILNFVHPKWDDYNFGFYSGMLYNLIARWLIYISLLLGIKYMINKFNKGQNWNSTTI